MESIEFYLIGIIFILLGFAFLVIPILVNTEGLRMISIPQIILYVYSWNRFYFATSPILIIISLVSFVIFLLRR